ncbi:MAG: vitamin K epoxide reductase family protein [Terriglobia bacterium]
MLLRLTIGVLSLAGLADSLYFTLAYYGRIRKARWVPEILCAREGSSCVTVVQTPYARVFGVPNSLLGILYYMAVMLWLSWPASVLGVEGYAHLFLSLTGALLLTSAATVVLGFYLVYALRRKLHVDCPLCYTAHVINVLLFILLTGFCHAVL